jgi:GWxTD domain-containing protein
MLNGNFYKKITGITMKNIVLLLIFVSYAAYSNPLFVAIDHTSFMDESGNYSWELTYSFQNNILTYIDQDKLGYYYGELFFDIEISSSTQSILTEQWVVASKVEYVNKEKVMNLLGRKSFQLQPGQYKAKLKVLDVYDDERNIETEIVFIVDKVDANNINLSMPVFAYEIDNAANPRKDWDKMFLRGNYYILPNSALEFVGESHNIKGFFEVYNADKFAQSGYNISYRIFDGAKRGLKSFNAEIIDNKPVQMIPFDLALDTVASGVYYLQIVLSYPIDSPVDSIEVEKKFYINNPTKPPVHKIYFTENEMFQKSEFATLDKWAVEDEFRKASVIAESGEKKQFESLTTLQAKQRFLFRFWYIRDSDTTTNINETLIEFRRREEYANTYFNTGYVKNGWGSDRGKVLLKYGMPSRREQYDGHFGYNSYEEWMFENVQGGAKFYFVDRVGNGHFRLVHSTARGEIYNENWYNDYVPSTRDIKLDDAHPTPSPVR